jgi:hypothetical protein
MFRSLKKFNLLLLAAFFFLGSLAVYSQNRDDVTDLTVSVVVASKSREIIPGARIVIESGSHRYTGISDAEGLFKAKLPRRTYRLIVTASGFDRFERHKLRIRKLPVTISAELVVSEIVVEN